MWTARGLVDVYLLVFLHVGSRRVWISPSTVQPDSAWVSLQARNFLMVAEDMSLSPEYLMRDNDVKFRRQFDDVFKTSGVEIKRTVPMSPNLRAHVERFIQTLKFESRKNHTEAPTAAPATEATPIFLRSRRPMPETERNAI